MTTTEFTTLYREHYPKLFGWVLFMTHDRWVTEDIVGRAMMKAWEHRGTLNGNAKSWLYQITVNETKDYWRRESYLMMEPLEHHQETPDPREFTRDIERYQAIQRAESIMQSLERRERMALHCHLIGNSIEEAAVILDVCEGTAGRRIWEAKRKCRSAYARELCAA